MLTKLADLGSSRRYWLALTAFCAAMLGVALYYQYVLEHLPCLVCIQVRILVLGIGLVAVVGLLAKPGRFGAAAVHLLVGLLAAVFFNRAWLLLGIERGTAFGDCKLSLGLPDWFALDTWFPKLFKVWEACGYTPELWFGITMAEALVVVSSLLFVTSLVLLAVVLLVGPSRRRD